MPLDGFEMQTADAMVCDSHHVPSTGRRASRCGVVIAHRRTCRTLPDFSGARLHILTVGNDGVRAGWSMAGPSVAGNVVWCDPRPHRDQINQRRMGRGWDVFGGIRVGLSRAGFQAVTNPLGLDSVKESALLGTCPIQAGPVEGAGRSEQS